MRSGPPHRRHERIIGCRPCRPANVFGARRAGHRSGHDTDSRHRSRRSGGDARRGLDRCHGWPQARARGPASRFGCLLAAGGVLWIIVECNDPRIGSSLAFTVALDRLRGGPGGDHTCVAALPGRAACIAPSADRRRRRLPQCGGPAGRRPGGGIRSAVARLRRLVGHPSAHRRPARPAHRPQPRRCLDRTHLDDPARGAAGGAARTIEPAATPHPRARARPRYWLRRPRGRQLSCAASRSGSPATGVRDRPRPPRSSWPAWPSSGRGARPAAPRPRPHGWCSNCPGHQVREGYKAPSRSSWTTRWCALVYPLADGGRAGAPARHLLTNSPISEPAWRTRIASCLDGLGDHCGGLHELVAGGVRGDLGVRMSAADRARRRQAGRRHGPLLAVWRRARVRDFRVRHERAGPTASAFRQRNRLGHLLVLAEHARAGSVASTPRRGRGRG